jgi:hypothetical protein
MAVVAVVWQWWGGVVAMVSISRHTPFWCSAQPNLTQLKVSAFSNPCNNVHTPSSRNNVNYTVVKWEGE